MEHDIVVDLKDIPELVDSYSKEFPLTKYERGIFVQCNCGSIEELTLDESSPIKITGRPKNIAEGTCSKCNRKIIVYASIWIGD